MAVHRNEYEACVQLSSRIRVPGICQSDPFNHQTQVLCTWKYGVPFYCYIFTSKCKVDELYTKLVQLLAELQSNILYFKYDLIFTNYRIRQSWSSGDVNNFEYWRIPHIALPKWTLDSSKTESRPHPDPFYTSNLPLLLTDTVATADTD